MCDKYGHKSCLHGQLETNHFTRHCKCQIDCFVKFVTFKRSSIDRIFYIVTNLKPSRPSFAVSKARFCLPVRNMGSSLQVNAMGFKFHQLVSMKVPKVSYIPTLADGAVCQSVFMRFTQLFNLSTSILFSFVFFSLQY